MSAETAATPKKSVLTSAMERARAATTTEVTDEQGAVTETKFNYKRLAIGVGALTAGAAVVYTALKLFTGESIEDETSDEDTVTED